MQRQTLHYFCPRSVLLGRAISVLAKVSNNFEFTIGPWLHFARVLVQAGRLGRLGSDLLNGGCPRGGKNLSEINRGGALWGTISPLR